MFISSDCIMARLFAAVVFLCIYSLVLGASDVPIGEDFEMIDGILFSKEELKRQAAIQSVDQAKADQAKVDEEEEQEFLEEYYDDDDDDEDDEEDPEAVKHLPTRCHVCRLLVVEVEEKLKKIGNVKKVRPDGRPIYFKEEIVIRQVFMDLCDSMGLYNIRRKQPFRYVYGANTKMRDDIIKTTKNSKIKRWVFITPEAEIDDPTGEIARLKDQCHKMLVDGQEDLVHWFMKAQSRNLTQWFCEKRVLVEQNQDCLKLELPKRRRIKARKGDQTDEASNMRREEL